MYLKQWLNSNNKVWAYETIVWDKRQPSWEERSISSTAYWRDFYTQNSEDGAIDDSVENLFGNEYEDKTEDIIRKVRAGEHLTTEEMSTLVDFAILQMARTPAAYLRNRSVMEHAFRSAASATAGKFLEMEPDPEFNKKAPAIIDSLQTNEAPFPPWTFSITMDKETGDYTYSMAIDRKNYLASIGHIINGETGKRLRSYEWSIVEMPEGMTLPTCDDPFVKADLRGLEQYGPTHHGSPQCTNCFMPLTPHHLLFADAGRGGLSAARLVADGWLLNLIPELIVYNALLCVYNREKSDWIERLRPCRADRDYRKTLSDAMKRWNELQSRVV